MQPRRLPEPWATIAGTLGVLLALLGLLLFLRGNIGAGELILLGIVALAALFFIVRAVRESRGG